MTRSHKWSKCPHCGKPTELTPDQLSALERASELLQKAVKLRRKKIKK